MSKVQYQSSISRINIKDQCQRIYIKGSIKDVISTGQNGEVKANVPIHRVHYSKFQSPIVHDQKGHNESLKQKINLAGSHHLFKKVRSTIPFKRFITKVHLEKIFQNMTFIKVIL